MAISAIKDSRVIFYGGAFPGGHTFGCVDHNTFGGLFGEAVTSFVS